MGYTHLIHSTPTRIIAEAPRVYYPAAGAPRVYYPAAGAPRVIIQQLGLQELVSSRIQQVKVQLVLSVRDEDSRLHSIWVSHLQ